MASGLPVITTKVGNLPYLIKEKRNGYFFDGSIEQLLGITRFLIENKNARQEISISARETISTEFSLNNLQNNLLKIYNMILS
jgi:glycosyltransferase involved in cell wall biosynthesis